MKNLQHLLNHLAINEAIGKLDRTINEVQFDSRKVTPNSVFVAVKGTQVDGHRFISKAIEKGAAVVVCEDLPTERDGNVTYILVNSSEQALGQLASAFYDHPSTQLKLVGVTGTNGKTTMVTLLYQLFTNMGYKVGLLSTVENKIAGRRIAATHTTPDAVQLNQMLARMVEKGCEYAFMEVSSHAIDQRRIAGVQFAGGIFTNITHDHLDYHQTFQNYLTAKKKFFDDLSPQAFALTNLDDRRGLVMLQNTKALKRTFSLKQAADFTAKMVENTINGLLLELDGREFHSRLIGEFNAYNLTAVYGAAVLLGADVMETLTVLSRLNAPEGRFDYIVSQRKKITGIVDYAHTPDALEKVLNTILHLKSSHGRVITVVGCGGDRDAKKRPIMAKVAADLSDQVILTSDNPRSEDPDLIIKAMEEGIPPHHTNKVVSVTDRAQAIRIACRLAATSDIILVAGKGHEKYQEIKGEKYPFDDKKILGEELERM